MHMFLTPPPCPALLVWRLNPGPPVWLAGSVSLVSAPSPHFFLLYTGKHEGLQAPILTGGRYRRLSSSCPMFEHAFLGLAPSPLLYPSFLRVFDDPVGRRWSLASKAGRCSETSHCVDG